MEASLSESCGGAGGVCHVQGLGGAPSWLKSPDGYVSIKAYNNSQTGGRRFITEVSDESRLFTKGNHSGTELLKTSALGGEVSSWIQAELLAETDAKNNKPTTEPVTLGDGTDVTVSLRGLGPGLKGATVSFTVSITGSLMTLSNMKATAPAANGIRLQHPLFIQVVGKRGTPDPGDSCANVDTKVKEGSDAVLGPGTLIFPGWEANSKLAISFDAIAPYTLVEGSDGGVTGPGAAVGCKNQPGYEAIAANFSTLSRNCVSCHGGGNAQNALDMSYLRLGTPDYKNACAAALNAVSLGNKGNSPIIAAPTTGSPVPHNSGGKLSAAEATAYRDAILSWLSGE